MIKPILLQENSKYIKYLLSYDYTQLDTKI